MRVTGNLALGWEKAVVSPQSRHARVRYPANEMACVHILRCASQISPPLPAPRIEVGVHSAQDFLLRENIILTHLSPPPFFPFPFPFSFFFYCRTAGCVCVWPRDISHQASRGRTLHDTSSIGNGRDDSLESNFFLFFFFISGSSNGTNLPDLLGLWVGWSRIGSDTRKTYYFD